MEKPIFLILIFTFVLFALVARETENRLVFKDNGFSIAPLEGKSGTAPFQTLMMFLPPTESFAPNINVQIQPYNGSIKDYAELSTNQIKTAKFKVLNEKVSEKTFIFEYSGLFQGRKLHWYGKAVLGDGKIYLVTATATESQWQTLSIKLKSCVNSFKQYNEKKAPIVK